MQSVSSRIWTRVAVFISYDDNDYTTGSSKHEFTKHLHYDQDVTQGQFLSEVKSVWIENFPSLRLLGSWRRKNLVYSTIYQ